MSGACPCGSQKALDECCGPLIEGSQSPSGPEALMRSRYSAYTQGNIDYLSQTLAPEAVEGFNFDDAREWSKNAQWQGLEVRRVSQDNDKGEVEFVAKFRLQGRPQYHHELANFRQVDGVWKYVDGVLDPKLVTQTAAKVGRNDPCPCGSGQKFKKCCGK